MSENKSQNELILEFFEAGGSLTVLEAGHPVNSEWEKLPSGKKVKRYFLAEPQMNLGL